MNPGSTEEDYSEVADTIVDMLESEAMLRARVSYGLPVKELKNVSKCYKEAKMALEVGSIFHSEMKVLYLQLHILRIQEMRLLHTLHCSKAFHWQDDVL